MSAPWRMMAWRGKCGCGGSNSGKACPRAESRNLAALGQGHGDLHGLAGTHNLHANYVSGGLGAQSVGEVVQVLDGLAVKLHHHVVGFEAGLGGGGAGGDIGELDAVDAFAEVRDGAEIRAIARRGSPGGTRTDRAIAVNRGRSDTYELRADG